MKNEKKGGAEKEIPELREFPDLSVQVRRLISELTEEEWSCLCFLYKEMPFSDRISYPPEHFVEVVRATLSARKTFVWADPESGAVPPELFYPYVLYERVNNESLDGNRMVFYREWKEIFKKEEFSGGENICEKMKRAALLVNEWCSRKASYQPADDRTLGPLGVVSRGTGRCGEESTLCVAALRSIGLPARQCYAPYWAHCDDNHAWVEVWTGEAWHFMGACEPETELDRAWFPPAASRSMMIRALRCGKQTVNLLSRYADTKLLRVEVRIDGSLAAGLPFAVELVNFSAAVPVYRGRLGTDGYAEVLTGAGDLLFHVWNPENGNAFWQRVDMRSPEAGGVIRMCFSGENTFEQGILGEGNRSRAGWQEFTMNPPTGRLSAVSPAGKADGCSEANGMPKQVWEKEAYEENAAPKEHWLCAAGGNAKEIRRFLSECEGEREDKELLLRTLREKDLADTTAEVLADAMAAFETRGRWPEKVFRDAVLAPRIENERLSAYREPIRQWVLDRIAAENGPSENRSKAGVDGRKIWTLLQERIRRVPVPEEETFFDRPAEWLKAEACPETGFSLLYVAACRSMGLAARKSPVDGRAEYGVWEESTGRFHWRNPQIYDLQGSEERLLLLTLVNASGSRFVYGTDFTLCRMERGELRLLHPETEEAGILCPGGELTMTLPEGKYRILVSARQIDGSLSVRLLHVRLEEDSRIPMRPATVEIRSKLKWAAGITGERMTEGLSVREQAARISEGRTPGADGFFLRLEPGKEPTEHLLRELLAKQEEIKQRRTGLHLFVAQPDTAGENGTLGQVLAAFPQAEMKAADPEEWERIRLAMEVGDARLPFAMAVSKEGQGLYAFANYEIGTVERLLAVLHAGRNPFTLEACVDSVESARAAQRGGADRLELCANLVIGGTTPTPALYQAVRRACSLPIRVLIRPRSGDFCYSPDEFSILCEEVRQFRKMGADGVVTGCLRPDGSLDEERMRLILAQAGDCDVALHRAFDMCSEPEQALKFCVENGIQTILTSGGKASCLEGKDMLRRYSQILNGLLEMRNKENGSLKIRTELMAGAGVNAEVIRKLRAETGLAAFHMSGKQTLESRMHFRKEGVSMGLPGLPEYELWRTDEEEIRKAKETEL